MLLTGHAADGWPLFMQLRRHQTGTGRNQTEARGREFKSPSDTKIGATSARAVAGWGRLVYRAG
jgi:hypothetical protein